MRSPRIRTLEDIDVTGKKILLRVAYDITLEKKDGKMVVLDDTRIRATLPTLRYLLQKGCALGLLSWLKRPAGKVVEEYRMAPVAQKLSDLLGKPVKALRNCVGDEVSKEIAALEPGEIVMLENVRFHPEEEKEDLAFAKELTKGFDLIVYDAFAQAHRVHASTTGILQILPAVAGFLFVKEIDYLSKILRDSIHPFVVVLGGAKISDRVEVMQNLIHKADAILVGGALANTFFASQGIAVEKSLVEDVYVNAAKGEKKDYQAIARELLTLGSKTVSINGTEVLRLQLPLDLVAAPGPDASESKVVNLDQGETIPAAWAFYDIGPRTIEFYGRVLQGAKMVFANGPMGLFEKEQFAGGTKQVAEAIIRSGAVSVIGGGDTESIVERYGWEGKFTHVSTGGGASLEFLAGKEFPVMKYLSR